jgi:hypothetical protein
MNKGNLIQGGIIILLIIAIFFMGRKMINSNNDMTNNIIAHINDRDDQIIKSVQDENGKTEIYLSSEISKYALKNSQEMSTLRKDLKQMNIRTKDVIRKMDLILSNSGKYKTDLKPILSRLDKLKGDTLSFANIDTLLFSQIFPNLATTYGYEYNQEFLKLRGTLNIKTGEKTGSYNYNSDISIIDHWNRKWFKRDELRVSLSTSDRNLNFRTKTYNIKSNKNIVDISLYGGYGFNLGSDGISNGFNVGLGVSKKILSIRGRK